MNPLRWPLHWQILGSLLLALALGIGPQLVSGETSASLEARGVYAWLIPWCDFLGRLFVQALKMVVVPLVAASIISGTMGIGADRHVGRMGLKIFVYYTTTSLLAIVLGLFLVNTIRPGMVSPALAQQIVGQAKAPEGLVGAQSQGGSAMTEIFLRMVPPNVIGAATDNGQLLGLIFFSLLFGFFASRLPARLREVQRDLWESVQAVMLAMTDVIIRCAPAGVFGLVLPVFVRTGFDVFVPLGWFFLTVLLGLVLHTFGTLSLLLRLIGRIAPLRHVRAMSPALLTAFSTASSASTLPVTMETTERNAGVSNRTASFVLPLGATVNMDGTALYECVVVLFIAQVYGVLEGYHLGLATQFYVVVAALLTSIGVAGIPSASLVAIVYILGAVGLPAEAVGLVWVTDRVLDMCRTAVNVYSDTCGAVIIARSEGEQEVYASHASGGRPGRQVSADIELEDRR